MHPPELRSLFVTNVDPAASGCAAIHESLFPIISPFDSNAARVLPPGLCEMRSPLPRFPFECGVLSSRLLPFIIMRLPQWKKRLLFRAIVWQQPAR
jgi:hypothetical protein